MNLTQDMIEHYYRTRLDSFKIRHSKGFEWRSRCPFHGGDNATTLKIDTSEGWFVCFACAAKGKDVFSFEQQMLKNEGGHVPEFGIVKEAISALLGTPLTERVYSTPVDAPERSKGGFNRAWAQARYIYTDETGDEQFSVWRFVDRQGKKATPPDMPCHCSKDAECPNNCQNGRVWGIANARRVLYRLPDVIQSALVFVVEGEKNVDDLSRAVAGYIKKASGFRFGGLVLDRVGVTTNPGGAMAWKPEFQFGKFFQSKVVIKLGDNDGPGRMHDEAACKDIAPYAHKLYTLALPVEEGEDISDYLADHKIEDFLKLLPSVVEYDIPEKRIIKVKTGLAPRQLLVKPSQLADPAGAGGDFLVPKLIRKGSRGLVVADPKTGKSLFFLDIALALANCQGVLGMPAYHRIVRVGIISREDGPEMVQDRLYCLARGRNLSMEDVDRHIRVNTSAQSSRFKIDNDEDLKEMAAWIKSEEIEFCVVDVLNKLHGAEENSNDGMVKVMQRFDVLAEQSGAQICVIHHSNGAGKGRGASSIDGWADYIFRLQSEPNETSIKTLTVRTKATGDVQPRQMQYWQSEDLKTSRINLVVPR